MRNTRDWFNTSFTPKAISCISFVAILLFVLPVFGAKNEIKEKAIFLDLFEVKIKKRDLGQHWENPFYFSSQYIGFQPDDTPKAYDAQWNREVKKNAIR